MLPQAIPALERVLRWPSPGEPAIDARDLESFLEAA